MDVPWGLASFLCACYALIEACYRDGSVMLESGQRGEPECIKACGFSFKELRLSCVVLLAGCRAHEWDAVQGG